MEDIKIQYGLMADAFLKEHFLVRTPFPTAIILLSYLFIVFVWGPSYMKERRPYKLKNIILVYDVVQIFINLYLIYKVMYIDVRQNSFDYKCTIASREMLASGYIYYLVKILDLVETVFFVLKKKHNQVSFLHVYHHVLILTVSYIGITSIAAGHGLVYGIVNCTVHAIMYTYYFISAYNPSSKLIKMKKFVTQIQLLQFVILFFHFAWPLVFGHCSVPPKYSWLGVSQALFMIYLFGKFYINAYIKKKSTKK